MFSKSKYFSPTTYMNFRFFLVNFQTPTLSIFDISMHDYMIVCYTMYIYIYETLPSNLLYIMQFFFPYKHISTCTTNIKYDAKSAILFLVYLILVQSNHQLTLVLFLFYFQKASATRNDDNILLVIQNNYKSFTRK